MGWAIAIIIGIVVIGIFLFIAPYNRFVRQRNSIQESWRQVDVELNRRYELIPNLIETVRAYAAHERNTLEEVTRLRNQAAAMSQGDSGASEKRSEVEAQLSGAVRNLLVSVEAYPDLKSNANFLELQRELTDTEDRIAAGRRFYNANVRAYNTAVESVPSNIVASIFNFEKASYFELNDPVARQAPQVNFGEISYRGPDQGGHGGGDQHSLGQGNPPAQQAYDASQFQAPPQGHATQAHQGHATQGHQGPATQAHQGHATQAGPQGYQQPSDGGWQAPPPPQHPHSN